MPKHHALSKIDGHFNLQGSTRDNVIFHKGSWGECSVVIRVLSPTHDNRAAGCHRTRASEIACWPKRASSMRRKFCRSAGGQRMPKDGLDSADPHPIDSKLNHPGNRHWFYLHCHAATLVLDRMTKQSKHGSKPSQRDAHTEQDPLVCRLWNLNAIRRYGCACSRGALPFTFSKIIACPSFICMIVFDIVP